MVPVLSLWLPILVAAVLVFVASFLGHAVLGYHNGDFAAVPDEDALMDAMRPFGLAPDDYFLPRAAGAAAMKDPEYVRKIESGPVIMMTVFPSGRPGMGKQLVQWFVFIVVVGVFTAYLTGLALGPGAEYLTVFRVAGTAAFMGYALGDVPPSIWFRRRWSTTLKNVFDGLVYGLLTAGVFGWLWPA